MNTAEIKNILKDIIEDDCGLVYTDAGNGSGGPGYADNATLLEMLESGNFEDAALVPTNKKLLRETYALVGAPLYTKTRWFQIEFAWGDGPNPYHKIAWIWQVNKPEPKPVTSIRLNPDLSARLDAEAKRQRRTRNNLIELILEDWLDAREEKTMQEDTRRKEIRNAAYKVTSGEFAFDGFIAEQWLAIAQEKNGNDAAEAWLIASVLEELNSRGKK